MYGHTCPSFRMSQIWGSQSGECLVPPDLKLETWMAFVKDFRYVEDWQVSGRDHYGDLRLTRLNFWAKPILRRWHFRKATWQYAEHFARYLAHLLFIFAT